MFSQMFSFLLAFLEEMDFGMQERRSALVEQKHSATADRISHKSGAI